MATSIVELAQAGLISASLGAPRLLTFMIVVPIFAPAIFPRMVRICVAIGLSAPVAAGVFHQVWQQPLPPDAPVLVMKEVALGLLLGVPVAAPLWALQSVGALIDNQRGANAAQQVTPFAQADASVIGASLMQAFIVMLAHTGAFVLIYQLLLQSYEFWPVLHLVPDVRQFGLDQVAHRFDDFMVRTVLYAAPLIAIILLVDFAFALMSVFAPQLQTYFASMPIKSLAAIVILAVYLFVLLSHADDYFRETLYRESRQMEMRSR